MAWFKSLYSFLVVAVATNVLASVNHEVTVGKGALLFSPETTVAQPGDTITFHFFPKNHSVTQSSFDEPCKPSPGGIFSGFVPTRDLEKASATTFTIDVKDSKPLWFYCGQTAGDHCQSGMVYSVNPPAEGNTFSAFKEKSKGAMKPSTSPPDPRPVGGLRKTSIQVGPAGTFTFQPANVSSLIGEILAFNFNPKNHSVTQSSFDKPCEPLTESAGFSSGFVPTQVWPSGATFELEVKDTKPLWFYCAQVNGNHCQSGMVGSVNAPLKGDKTFDTFLALAKNAPTPSRINAQNPTIGKLIINGTVIAQNDGKGFGNGNNGGTPPPPTPPSPQNGGNSGNDPPKEVYKPIASVPQPGANVPQDVADMAGGYQPTTYHWGPQLSDKAEKLLQLLNWVDNVLVEALMVGHANLTTGSWKNLYPPTITNTLGSMGAQAIVHRSTATDSLSHYQKQIMGNCQYNWPISKVEDFTKVVLHIALLEIGLLLDIIASVVSTDPWLVGCLASTLGSKSRMAGMVNMMQNHIPAAAPREALLPAELVYSYVANRYVVKDSCPQKLSYTEYPPLKISPKGLQTGADARMTEVEIESVPAGDHWMAWIGAWGKVWYTKVQNGGNGKGTASVPNELSGHVWGVLTNAADVKLEDLEKATVAGPEMVWVTQPGGK